MTNPATYDPRKAALMLQSFSDPLIGHEVFHDPNFSTEYLPILISPIFASFRKEFPTQKIRDPKVLKGAISLQWVFDALRRSQKPEEPRTTRMFWKGDVCFRFHIPNLLKAVWDPVKNFFSYSENEKAEIVLRAMEIICWMNSKLRTKEGSKTLQSLAETMPGARALLDQYLRQELSLEETTKQLQPYLKDFGFSICFKSAVDENEPPNPNQHIQPEDQVVSFGPPECADTKEETNS